MISLFISLRDGLDTEPLEKGLIFFQNLVFLNSEESPMKYADLNFITLPDES